MATSVIEILSQLALIAFPFLLGIVAWFVQRLINEVKAQLATDALARAQFAKEMHEAFEREAEHRMQMEKDMQGAFAREASSRLVGDESVRKEVADLRTIVHALMREVDKDYVNFERLEGIMRPLQQSLETMSRDLREGQTELLKRLDGKMDKP